MVPVEDWEIARRDGLRNWAPYWLGAGVLGELAGAVTDGCVGFTAGFGRGFVFLTGAGGGGQTGAGGAGVAWIVRSLDCKSLS